MCQELPRLDGNMTGAMGCIYSIMRCAREDNQTVISRVYRNLLTPCALISQSQGTMIAGSCGLCTYHAHTVTLTSLSLDDLKEDHAFDNVPFTL